MQTNEPQTNGKVVIGFLGYREYEDGGAYRGAILITDEWSKPIEFRCTAPVRPTALQRTLYGKSLLPHILSELIGEPLVGSVREKPELIFITADAYFDLRCKISIPVLKIRRKNGGAKSEADERGKIKAVLLESASGRFEQVEIEAHWRFPNDSENCGEKLREFFGRWDLAEPFQRLSEGLDYVNKERLLES